MRPPTISPAETATDTETPTGRNGHRHVAIYGGAAANPANEHAGEHQEARSIA
jgi:hypothetical protein